MVKMTRILAILAKTKCSWSRVESSLTYCKVKLTSSSMLNGNTQKLLLLPGIPLTQTSVVVK